MTWPEAGFALLAVALIFGPISYWGSMVVLGMHIPDVRHRRQVAAAVTVGAILVPFILILPGYLL